MGTQAIVGILVSLAAIASYINYKFVKLPNSIGITLVTLGISLIVALASRYSWDVEFLSQSLLDGVSFDETFLHGMLSFLLFAGSLHVNAIELAKYKVLVAFLATISVAISSALIGYAMHGLTSLLGIDLPFYYCFVFGALISPTDPIAVMGILKSIKVPKYLGIKIAGEALFNDGMGILLFFAALTIASGKEELLTPNTLLFLFIRQGVGGLILGSAMGYLAGKLISTVDDYEVSIILTLAIVTGGYTLALYLAKVSAPITIATAGLFIGNFIKNGNMGKMSENTLKRLTGFWELLDAVLNSILFVLIGLEFMHINFDIDTTIAAIGAIIITIVARWVSIVIPVGYLPGALKKFSPDVMLIMTWGGLRGGISIALALSIQGIYHNFIVTITYAVVIFSMMVQGLTIGPLIRRIISQNAAFDDDNDTIDSKIQDDFVDNSFSKPNTEEELE
jgi:monovalent cation:H+ antiporter, CPA1 family